MDLDEELAGLAPDENIFEVHLAGAALDEGVLGKNPPTFLSMDFFEHETQATAVVSSVTPEYDHTVQVEALGLATSRDLSMFAKYWDPSPGWDSGGAHVCFW